MKKILIISTDSYLWFKYCAGLLIEEDCEKELIILKNDSERPILNCKNLCKEAIYEQRRYDVFQLCKRLGIKKASNLAFEDNLSKLIMQLQVTIRIGQISEVYFSFDDILYSILYKMEDKDIYGFGNYNFISKHLIQPLKIGKTRHLDEETIKTKKQLTKHMVGVPNRKYLHVLNVETFYNI